MKNTEKMLALKRNDIVDYEDVVNGNENSYCGICTAVAKEETWGKHVEGSPHGRAEKRFKFLYEHRNGRIRCKLCSCEVAWEDRKQHETSHFLIPWDSTETGYNKYEIFFENMILLCNDLFSCCLCNSTFAEWSVALVHVTDPKHQSLKQKNARKFDNTMITSETELSFKLLVEEGIFAFDEMNVECKFCQREDIPISCVVRHLKSLIHVCKKSKFVLKRPAELSVDAVAQLASPSFTEAASEDEETLGNCDQTNFQNDYIVKISENKVVCVICAVEISFSSINIHSHNRGKAHSRSLEKYGCQYISRFDGDVFHCKLCECTLQGHPEVHLHIKEKKHSEASMGKILGLTEKSAQEQTSSSLRKLNAIGLNQRITQLSKISSSLRKPNSTKPHQEVVPVEKLSSSLPQPNSINSSEELTPEKQLPTSVREPNCIELKSSATPMKILRIPARKPFSIESARAITESKTITSSLRRPNSVEPSRDVVQGQEPQDSSSQLNASVPKGAKTASEKLLQKLLPEKYTDDILLVNNLVNNNTTVAEDPDAFQESFDYITSNETTAFCHICRCSLSPSPRNISLHVIGNRHRISFHAYGCDHIERKTDATYFCKCCNTRNIALEQLHLHVITPKHLYNVRDDEREKLHTLAKPNKQQIIGDTKTPELVPKTFQAAISLDDVVDGICANIEKDAIDFVGNDIITLENREYFCIRCSCQISGMPNVEVHLAGKKHEKTLKF